MIAYTIPQVKKKIRELINGYFCPELENKVIPPNIEEENAWEHTFSLITKNLKKTLEENKLIKDNAWIFADNVILFNLEDYLDYVRSSPKYKSKFTPAKREYSKSHPDGVEISIFKNEI